MSRKTKEKTNDLSSTDNWGREDLNARGEYKSNYSEDRNPTEEDERARHENKEMINYDQVTAGLDHTNDDELLGRTASLKNNMQGGTIPIDDPKGKAEKKDVEDY